MTPIVENAQLSTDLDARWNTLQRVLHFYPVPGNLVQITDPRLFDGRNMLPGSVINESVSPQAAIVQSKLNLNGLMPSAWFAPPGPPPAGAIDQPAPAIWAARGDLAELKVRKGAPNGYAAVDDNLRLYPANVTQGPGLGTVSEVHFSFPNQFLAINQLVGSDQSCSVAWEPAPNNSWFGVFGDTGHSGVSAGSGGGPGLVTMEPQFHVEPLPDVFFPKLDADKFTTGQFAGDTLPVAVYGPNHSHGAVPDPGGIGDGDPDEYLARDMSYRHFDAQHFYQPKVDKPTITLISIQGSRITVTIRTEVPGALLFDRLGRPSFHEVEAPEFTLLVPRGMLLEAYAAKEGYKNSDIASYTAPLEDVPGPDSPIMAGDFADIISEDTTYGN